MSNIIYQNVFESNSLLLNDTNIQGGVTLSQSVNSGDGLVLGSCCAAKAMGRTDVAFAIRLSKEFGLRVSEVARIRLEHIEKALDNDHLWVKGKGGQVREVPVERPEQRELLDDLKAYATKNGLQGMELVLSENKKHGVKRKIDSWQNWVINHRSKFTEADRTNDVKEGYKPKVNKITFHGLRHYYTQKRGEWLEENHIRNAKRNLSESLGHHRESITKIYSNKK